MNNIELTNSDSNFVSYTLRHYARTTGGLDAEDRDAIIELAGKFRI
jgi:hypothetical protein